MAAANNKEITGAWVIHHGRKLTLDANGSAEFPAIDEAAKAGTLLAKLGQTKQTNIEKTEVKAIAVSSGLNPRYELDSLLEVLQRKRLIDQSTDEVSILGVTGRAALSHAADMYLDAEPNSYEQASISLAEMASDTPVRRGDISEKLGDEHKLTKIQVSDFLDRAEEIGFVDKEGSGNDRILFNGNLFRRDSVKKSEKILSSLNETEKNLVTEVSSILSKEGCIAADRVEKILSAPLLEKLIAAGFYDLNQVNNEQGYHIYITSPSAFHKFVDPMVDDTFDMAKSLVAALSYGMTKRSISQGRIGALSILLGKLITGYEVGPATAIGEDYRVLEINRVVKLRSDERYPNRYHMKLLKKEIGELALHVLTRGSASGKALIPACGKADSRGGFPRP